MYTVTPPAALAMATLYGGVAKNTFADSSSIVVESDRRALPELEDVATSAGLAIERQRSYGDTSITIHRRQ